MRRCRRASRTERLAVRGEERRPSANLLFFARTTPGARAGANKAREDSREVTLICEAAGQGDLCECHAWVAQLLLGYIDAAREKPTMRCGACRAVERTREMAHR